MKYKTAKKLAEKAALTGKKIEALQYDIHKIEYMEEEVTAAKKDVFNRAGGDKENLKLSTENGSSSKEIQHRDGLDAEMQLLRELMSDAADVFLSKAAERKLEIKAEITALENSDIALK